MVRLYLPWLLAAALVMGMAPPAAAQADGGVDVCEDVAGWTCVRHSADGDVDGCGPESENGWGQTHVRHDSDVVGTIEVSGYRYCTTDHPDGFQGDGSCLVVWADAVGGYVLAWCAFDSTPDGRYETCRLSIMNPEAPGSMQHHPCPAGLEPTLPWGAT